MDDDPSWLLYFYHFLALKPAARIFSASLGFPVLFHFSVDEYFVTGVSLLIQTHIFQRHSQLPQGWSPSDRRWWWQKALSELTLEVFFGLCVTGQVRFGATESGTGELVLWGFKDFPRIFQRFSKVFPRIFQEGWRANEVIHIKRADMYWYVSSTAANAGLGQEKTNLTNYRRLKFVSLHLYSLAALPVVNLCGHASNTTLLDSYNKMRTVPTNANHILLLLCCCGCSMIFGCEPFTNPSWANRGGQRGTWPGPRHGKTRWSPLWFASSQSFRRRALLATTGAVVRLLNAMAMAGQKQSNWFSPKVKLKSPGRPK